MKIDIICGKWMMMPKLTKAQKAMVERIAELCSDKKFRPDGNCDLYDITHGHTAKEKCLENLVKLGVVKKWHSKQKTRSAFMGSCTSDDGFTLYRLAPVGIRMVYDKVLAEEQDNSLEKRIIKRMEELRISEKELKEANVI